MHKYALKSNSRVNHTITIVKYEASKPTHHELPILLAANPHKRREENCGRSKAIATSTNKR